MDASVRSSLRCDELTTEQKRAAASEAWRALFDFILLTANERNRIIGELGLTPNDSRALSAIEAGRTQAMRALAEAWGCDASTATWIVDRLEKRGLVRRQSDPKDRRVTLVSLTRKGVNTRARLLRSMYEPPAELLALPERDLAVLREACAKLPK